MRVGRVRLRCRKGRDHVLKAYYASGIVLGSITEGRAKLGVLGTSLGTNLVRPDSRSR